MQDIHSTNIGGEKAPQPPTPINLPSNTSDGPRPVLFVDTLQTFEASKQYLKPIWAVYQVDPQTITYESYLSFTHAIIWGRNDEGGLRWAEEVAARLAIPRYVMELPKNLDPSWDLSQPLPSNIPPEAVERHLTKCLGRCIQRPNGHHSLPSVLPDADEERAAIVAEAEPAPLPAPIPIDPKAPMDVARSLVDHRHTVDGHRALHHQQQEFFAYTGTHYRPLLPEESKASVYRFLETCEHAGKSTPTPVRPNRNLVGNVEDALRAVCQLPGDIRAPAWLESRAVHPPAQEIVAARNALLHLPTGRTMPHTPLFFAHSALEYDYAPTAPEPKTWLSFLNSLWADDPECVATLQEMFGYLLSGAVNHQKIFLLIGPMRSGKGTIGKIINALLGPDAVESTSFPTLEQNFGLAPLIGKSVAILSDARLGGGSNQAAVAEKLLSISGEDKQSIDRKFLGAWSGRLAVRFVVMTNEIPQITDASGALASRFIIMTMSESFLGREDKTLDTKLYAELPGILNWAIKGYHRLAKRGYFEQPGSSQDTVKTLQDLSAPVAAFVRDCCALGPHEAATKDALFKDWKIYCADAGIDHVGTKDTFCKKLLAAVPKIAKTRGSDAGKRSRVFSGIGLKPRPPEQERPPSDDFSLQ